MNKTQIALEVAAETGIPVTMVGTMTNYEYTTRQVQTTLDTISVTFDADMNANRWYRVWADVQSKDTFIVYRRKVAG